MNAQTSSEAYKQAWITYITENTSESFKIMKDDVDFYAEVTENLTLTPDDVDDILDLTDSIECRAMLLEYKRNL